VRLARPAEEIRLRDVVEAFQGPLRLLRCRLEGNGCPCHPDCAIYRLWFTLDDSLGTMLERVHIGDLLQTCGATRWTHHDLAATGRGRPPTTPANPVQRGPQPAADTSDP